MSLRGLIFGISKNIDDWVSPCCFDYLLRNVIQNPKYDRYQYIEAAGILKTMI